MGIATFNDVISVLNQIKADYVKHRATFIKGKDMLELLKGLGANEEDIDKLKQVSNFLPKDPTLPFRKSKNGRFCFDMEIQKIERLEFQPFILSAEEDFVRHDSGQLRRFEEIDNDLQGNSVFQALLRFKAFMV